MRIRSRASLLCLLGLFVVGAVAVVTADEGQTIQVQFFDGNGVLQTDRAVDVTVFDAITGAPLYKTSLPADPDGTYDVPVGLGDKVGFRVFGSEATLAGYEEIQITVPGELPGPLPITVLGGPANDDCVDAIAVGSLPALVAGTTVGAATDPEAGSSCGTSITTGGVWYTVVGTGTVLTASTCNDGNPATGSASYDSKLSIFCQNCDALTCIAGNDDAAGCAGFSSRITWCSQAGATYRILVHGFGSAQGNFELAVTDGGQQCTAQEDCFPPIPTGACCNCLPNPPFNCTESSAEECDTVFGGEYQGDDTACIAVSGDPFVYISNPALAIPDNNPAGVTTDINVPDSFFIADLNVDIGISHTFIGDLILRVTHAGSGLTQELWTNQCGGTDNINSTADDEGTVLSCALIASGPIDSIFWPPAIGGQGPLSIFDGLDANGTWTFFVNDTFAADTGVVNQWSLHFQGGQPVCTGGGNGGPGGDPCLQCAPEADGKVTICHFPPGNPANAQTIRVSPSALPAHCNNHGDSCGECDSRPLIHNDINAVGQQDGGAVGLGVNNDRTEDSGKGSRQNRDLPGRR